MHARMAEILELCACVARRDGSRLQVYLHRITTFAMHASRLEVVALPRRRTPSGPLHAVHGTVCVRAIRRRTPSGPLRTVHGTVCVRAIRRGKPAVRIGSQAESIF